MWRILSKSSRLYTVIRNLGPTKDFYAIIFNLGMQTQQQTVWKAVENLVDLHATGMVQRRLDRHYGGLVLLVRPLEVCDLMVALEVPDAGCDLVDQVVVMGDEENC